MILLFCTVSILATGAFTFLRKGERGFEEALAAEPPKPTLADRRAKAQAER